jgi:hypothetical protein
VRHSCNPVQRTTSETVNSTYGPVPANAGYEARVAAMLKLMTAAIQTIVILRRLLMADPSLELHNLTL